MVRYWFAATLTGALLNAVPSPAALNPRLAVLGLNEGDIAGSGMEVQSVRRSAANSRESTHRDKTAREWREMAARCRNLARWLDADQRATLAQLADEYEARAIAAENAGGRDAEKA